MNHATRLLLALVTLPVALGLPRRLDAQDRPLSVEQITKILESGGEDDFDMPEFVAAAYGPRARPALESILERPSTRANFLLQLAALTAAQYPRVGVRTALLLDYVEGPRLSAIPVAIREVLRTRALKALSTQPDPSLQGFWMKLQTHPTPLYRQFAPFGLACSIGTTALPDLEAMSRGVDSVLVRQANRALHELVERGTEGRICGRVSRGEAPQFPREVRPGLMARGQRFLSEIP